MEENNLKNPINQMSTQYNYSFTSMHESVITYVDHKKNNSFMTIIMTTNTMTMTAILILPLLY